MSNTGRIAKSGQHGKARHLLHLPHFWRSEDHQREELEIAIAINILDFVRIKDVRSYHSRFRLLEMEERIELTDAIEIHFIELPKLQGELANYDKPLDRWAMFLKGWDDMELMERLSEEDPAIAKARQALEEMAADPRAKEIYEQRLKAIMDRNSDLYEAELKGELKGKLETARAALEEGLEPLMVEKITGLPMDTIQNLQAEIAQLKQSN